MQVGGSVLGVDPRVCVRVRACHRVFAQPDQRTVAGQQRAREEDLTAVDPEGRWAGLVSNACRGEGSPNTWPEQTEEQLPAQAGPSPCWVHRTETWPDAKVGSGPEAKYSS